jgi:hypothetical protein
MDNDRKAVYRGDNFLLKINDNIVLCDLITIKNKKTGEEKNIYFDISYFFGK